MVVTNDPAKTTQAKRGFDSQLLAITHDGGGFMASESPCIYGQEADRWIMLGLLLPFDSVQDPSPHLGWVFSSYLIKTIPHRHVQKLA